MKDFSVVISVSSPAAMKEIVAASCRQPGHRDDMIV
jgi:hypothetical protein